MQLVSWGFILTILWMFSIRIIQVWDCTPLSPYEIEVFILFSKQSSIYTTIFSSCIERERAEKRKMWKIKKRSWEPQCVKNKTTFVAMHVCSPIGGVPSSLIIVAFVLKSRICHFAKWQIRPFNTWSAELFYENHGDQRGFFNLKSS